MSSSQGAVTAEAFEQYFGDEMFHNMRKALRDLEQPQAQFVFDMKGQKPVLVLDPNTCSDVEWIAKKVERRNFMKNNPAWEVGWQAEGQSEIQLYPRTRPNATYNTVSGNRPDDTAGQSSTQSGGIISQFNGATGSWTWFPLESGQSHGDSSAGTGQADQEPEQSGRRRRRRGKKSGR